VERKPEPNLRGYEQKPHIRPVHPGECAKHHKAVPDRVRKVNAELVQGKFTFLSGESWNPVSGSRL
jgi:hypothetical protein